MFLSFCDYILTAGSVVVIVVVVVAAVVVVVFFRFNFIVVVCLQ